MEILAVLTAEAEQEAPPSVMVPLANAGQCHFNSLQHN
jgi:hypothetical protein